MASLKSLPALKPQTANKEHIKGRHFVAVTTAGKATYALTIDAILCKLSNKNGNMTKFIKLHSSRGFTLTSSADYVLCGCAAGMIRICNAKTLEPVVTLPIPPPMGMTNVTDVSDLANIAQCSNTHLADTLAV